jgi:4,5-dihydroxyphthalate decarboxylase
MRLVYGNDYYDKIRALVDGEVRVDGVELDSVFYPAPELFFRVLKYAEFDLAEMSFTSFLVALGNVPDFPYLALPIFPIRKFFHTDILCNVNAGIERPSDLVGKRFGLPEYQMSLAIWTRAALESDFGVAPSQINWFEERGEEWIRDDVLGITRPPGVSISRIPTDQSLSTMLLNGDLDAVVGSGLQTAMDRSGATPLEGRPEVRRLFEPREEGVRFFSRHGYIPPNHVIILKRQLFEQHPGLADSLFQAFEQSKAVYYQRRADEVANTYRRRDVSRSTGLLWLKELILEQERLFGPDPSPSGMRANRRMIDDCIQTLHQQGFLSRPLEPESVFAQTLLDT